LLNEVVCVRNLDRHQVVLLLLGRRHLLLEAGEERVRDGFFNWDASLRVQAQQLGQQVLSVLVKPGPFIGKWVGYKRSGTW
jgi:hypothetical protein